MREQEPAYRCRMRERKRSQTDWRRNALRNETVYHPKVITSKKNSTTKRIRFHMCGSLIAVSINISLYRRFLGLNKIVLDGCRSTLPE